MDSLPMPAVREQASHSQRCVMIIPDPLPTEQGAGPKRARDAESGDASPRTSACAAQAHPL